VPDDSESIPFQRVAIIGTGLIGGSFGLALRRALPQISVVGFDRPDVLASACSLESVEETAKDIPAAVRRADLVYIALPISATIDALPAIAAAVRDGTLVTDTGSTKVAICSAAQRAFRGAARFLGGHPMAGKEESGIAQADSDLFARAPYALVGKEDDPDPRIQGFASLLSAIGSQPVWCDAVTHDWAVGVVSHLPQMLSVALARVVGDETDETALPLSLAGPGLRDMLRLSGSPYGLWRDVALTNTENIARTLSMLEQAVEYLRTRLTSRELEQEFRSANETYRLLKKSE
jgi:prephenate dehydrogenase